MISKRTFLMSVLTAVAALCLFGTTTAFAKANNNLTQTVDGYTIALKVLPAEPFVSVADAKKSASAGAMVNGGGVEPMAKDSPKAPNHHIVVFIKKDGKTVENADVTMAYKNKNSSSAKMTSVPVTRMWVAGKGKKTMHYGNNVNMDSGEYQVQVVVNSNAKASFDINVP
ncbi:MAG: hypothetical protein PF501_07410 [Salinisphaera sp.]|jgi:hypothetical protein|nr:hypothetical protein [Salinisphaera sp.]